MQECFNENRNRFEYTQNRELSWLNFNQRVLEEAQDQSNPDMERLKFISIFSSNLDEFFMVRVGSLFDLARTCPDETDIRSGMTPSEQLDKIYNVVPDLIQLKEKIYSSVMSSLKKKNVEDLTFDQLSKTEYIYVKEYFNTKILPILFPIIIGSHHPVPHLINKNLYVAALLQTKQKKHVIGLIPIPDALPSYLKFEKQNSFRYIRMETIILHWVQALFGTHTILESCVACFTRNSDINFENADYDSLELDFRNRVSTLLKEREDLSIVRFELSTQISDGFSRRLERIACVEKKQIFVDSCPLNMKYVFQLVDDMSAEFKRGLLYPAYVPRWPEDMDRNKSIISQIRKKDELLFYPFDSTEPFLKLLREASEHPDVVSIKITIYRLAASSQIAHILCRAAENGKHVIVMMELRARFDEANNVAWSKLLEYSGCQIIYGVEDFKCHSKICQITLNKHGKYSYITQIGTGNYNEKTNKMYTDLSYITTLEEIGEDANIFFQNLLINKLDGEYKHFLVSPNGIEQSVCQLIDEQIGFGKEGYICFKMNSLTDCEIIDKLIEASRAGVKVDLIVRGICCLLPGIPGLSENIQVTSIVGRFLEHARIYCFGKEDNNKMYISSADFMGRNLHHRVEIACPIYDSAIKKQLVWILKNQLMDTIKASRIDTLGKYSRKKATSDQIYDSQQIFMNQSLHTIEGFVPNKNNITGRMFGFIKEIF